MRAPWIRLSLAAALSAFLAGHVFAMGDAPPEDKPAATTKCKANDKNCKVKGTTPAKLDCKGADKGSPKCPKQSFLENYNAAVALINAGKYEDALVAMHEIDDGTSADVTNYIGYINRKLGKMAEAQMYYEAALHMKPNHRGALEYYGEWYCMMGNLDKARQNLDLIANHYGADTKEYRALAKMIDETVAHQKS